ncbi:MAG: ChaB family protein [Anaerolineales bacterium]|nr:ChaB family protein [Anaerolineales bacterium]MCW5887177.1 ChaB family protein [Anaerolineales bacterium]
MPYETLADLPKGVKDNLPTHAQEIYLAAFNNAFEEYDKDEDRARRVAWSAVKKAGYEKDEASGDWKKTR